MSRTILHKHHIIPKHAGGTDDPSNLIYLTVEEHAEAHRLLFEQHGCWQDELAWLALSGHIGKEEINRTKSSEGAKKQWQDSAHRQKISNIMKETMTGREPWNKGKINVYSDNTRKSMSESAKGNTRRRGKVMSEESRRRMSISALNRKKKSAVSE